ncbi:MAG: response regulator transcription factor [Bacteroidetes bacterium]|nr:response regulator transcription factor [Bacteroidota bacterium]
MKPLRVIIADDEGRVRSTLKNLIKLHYADAEVVAEAGNIQSSAAAIRTHRPDVVLLDIKMPGGSGFELLKMFTPPPFHIIFITAYDKYAVQAFRFSALDYLLKPVIPEELVSALTRAQRQIASENISEKIQVFMDNISGVSPGTKKIVLPGHDKIEFVSINEIVRCEADRNYTRFFLTNKAPILVSGSLIKYDEMLTPSGFFRCHHSHLVNLFLVDRYEKRDGGTLIMKDGSKVEVATRKYGELVAALKKI